MTSKERIHKAALAALEQHPQGLHFAELRTAIQKALPDVPTNTIHGNTWNLDVTEAKLVVKPARGLFVLKKYHAVAEATEPDTTAKAPKVKEEDFYDAFAKWLVEDVEECTRAVAVGGNAFKNKWGTPDVVGVRASKKSDIIQQPTEIVTAEIKIDTQGLITAFGQACAYKLFAHRAYIVVPQDAPEADLTRLEALSLILGLGLIVFGATNPKSPNFLIRSRAQKHEPDMFYVNQNMKLLEDELFS